MRKKVLAVCLAAVMVGSLVACTTAKKNDSNKAEADTTTQLANPNLYDVTLEEAAEKAQVELTAPDGSDNVKYNVIGADEKHPTIEMEFTLDGKTYFERGQVSDLTSLALEGSDIDIDKLIESGNISGIYGKWTTSATTVIKECNGVKATSEDGSFVAWLDTKQGILYNLYTTELEKDDALEKIADKVFVPLVDDENAKSFDDVMEAISKVKAGTTDSSQRAREAGNTIVAYVMDFEVDESAATFKDLAQKWFAKKDAKDPSIRKEFMDNLGAVTELIATLDDEFIYDNVYENLVSGITAALENK